jgi:hypothetical protein
MKEVEDNPFPFFMLLSASNIPINLSKGYEMVICQATDAIEFYAEKLSGAFNTAWNNDVYQFTSMKWGEFPHLAIAYYDEKKKELLRTALTTGGFEGLTQELAEAGLNIDADPSIVVSPGMVSATERILGKKIILNPYEKLFKKDSDESEELTRINAFLQLVIPFYNADQKPDIRLLAQKAVFWRSRHWSYGPK